MRFILNVPVIIYWQLHECINLLRQCPAHLTVTICHSLIGFITRSLKCPIIFQQNVPVSSLPSFLHVISSDIWNVKENEYFLLLFIFNFRCASLENNYSVKLGFTWSNSQWTSSKVWFLSSQILYITLWYAKWLNYFLSLTEYFFRSCWRRSNGDFAISTEEYSCFAGMIHKYIYCNEYKHMMKNPVCNTCIYLLIESVLTVNDDFICFLQKQFSIYLTLDQYMKPDVRRNTLVTFMKEFFKKVRSRSVSWFCVGKNKKTMF